MTRWHKQDRDPSFYQYQYSNPVVLVDPLGDPTPWTWPEDVWNYFTGGVVEPKTSEQIQRQKVANDSAGKWLQKLSPVRGGYVGCGWGGKMGKGTYKPGWQGGGNVKWTIDNGLGLEAEGGIGLQMRTRDSRTNMFQSGIGGVGGSVGWSEGEGRNADVGGYFGSNQNGKTYRGGGHVVGDTDALVGLGINYGWGYGGLLVDPSRLANLYGLGEEFDYVPPSLPPLPRSVPPYPQCTPTPRPACP